MALVRGMWSTAYEGGEGGAGWTEREQFSDHSGGYTPGVTWHNSALHTVYSGTDYDRSAWWRAWNPAKGWQPGRKLDAHSTANPLVASYNGKLYAAFTSSSGKNVIVRTLDDDGKLQAGSLDLSGKSALSMAVHDGKLHLLLRRSNYDGALPLGHVIHDGVTTVVKDITGSERAQAGAALASHDGKLHLAYGVTDYQSAGEEERLRHSVWDGTAWSEPVISSRQGQVTQPSMASYDGRLHLAYRQAFRAEEYLTALGEEEFKTALNPRGYRWGELLGSAGLPPDASAADPKVRAKLIGQAIRSEMCPRILGFTVVSVLDGGQWSAAARLHVNAESGPELTVCPADGDGPGRLLVAYQGTEYVQDPPPPPPEPVGDPVGEPVTESGTDYGVSNWIKVNHNVSAQLLRNKNGKYHIRARWTCDPYYKWGLAWYQDSAWVSGVLEVSGVDAAHEFRLDTVGPAAVEFDVQVPRGEYQVTFRKGHKSGGYWFPWKNLDVPHYYSETDLERLSVVINVP